METNLEQIHPKVQKAMDSIHTEDVQNLIRALDRYGLAVAVPHMHGESGCFEPLPKDIVSYEAGLKVSFLQKDDEKVHGSVPVMWRWNDELSVASVCFSCSGNCCN